LTLLIYDAKLEKSQKQDDKEKTR